MRNAIEFVKEFGWYLAKEYVDECPSYCNYLHEHGFYSISETWQLNKNHVLVLDLKRLVKSHKLVESFGGLDLAKECLGQLPNKYQSYTLTRDDTGVTTQSFKLQQAIADVESCQ